MEWLTSIAGIAGTTVVVLIAVLAFIASRYEKVGPNEVLIISGRRSKYQDPETLEAFERNFAIYHGGGTFVLPVRERVDRMSVELMTLEIKTPQFYTKFGVPIGVDAIAQIKVRSDDPVATATAAEMFLSKGRDEMNNIAHQMMQGHLRAVISTLPFEECHANPEAFAQQVQRLTGMELGNMGIQVVSFTIRGIQDPSGYLEALGRPQMAQVHRDAALGEANANRDASVGKAAADREASVASAAAHQTARLAELSAELAIAGAQREREAKGHGFDAEIAEARASADSAYELQIARMQQQIQFEKIGVSRVERQAQIEVEDLEIERRRRELTHTIEAPALAERRRIETLAEAEQMRIRSIAQAEADGCRLRGLADADVVRARGEAEAEAIRLRQLAEAEGLRAKHLADAEGMRRKAEAWKEYNAAAVYEMLIDRLPELAQAVASPLQQVDRIVMVNTGGSDSGAQTAGVERVTRSVTEIIGQIPGIVAMLTGLDMSELLAQVPGLGSVAAQAGSGTSSDGRIAASTDEDTCEA